MARPLPRSLIRKEGKAAAVRGGPVLAAWVLVVALSGCVQLQVGAAPPPAPAQDDGASATFTWTPASPRVGQVVTFKASVKSPEPGDAVASVAWSFGDGTGGSGMTVEHVFRAAGERQVRMLAETTLSGKVGAARDVTVQAASPTAASTASSAPVLPSTSGLGPLEPPTIFAEVDANVVRFSYRFDALPDVVAWEFGDGATSSEATPTHTYISTGSFQVRLRLLLGTGVAENGTVVLIEEVPYQPRVVVGVTDSGINPYHEVYRRPERTVHPCLYVLGYDDCSVPALNLTVGPDDGDYRKRLDADADEWSKVKSGGWYWVPGTNLIAIHCPPGGSTQGGRCILDDESNHGTGTTSSVLTEAPDALIVFNDGSDSSQLAGSPVPIDIESNSWGSLAPLYGGLVNGPTGQQVCHDDIDAPTSLKFRSAGNNGPVPNLGDCWRNGYRSYSVSGGYPDGSHGEQSGSTPDFGSYWCRPVAAAETIDSWRNACGTSFAAPTAAGTAAAALLQVRRALGHDGPSTTAEVAPGITHEAFMEAIIMAATYEPAARPGFPSGGLGGPATSQAPWVWWGWGWLDAQMAAQAADCALGLPCPDNKPAEAWAFNEARRSFASDGQAG
jgi:chitodextrinase